MPFSYSYGKHEITDWVKSQFPKGSTALDVGAGAGIYADLLGKHLVMDACEIYAPNIPIFGLKNKYREVFVCDIAAFKYDWYDLIIFGDVIEHLPVETAQAVIAYAKDHSKDMIIAVPYLSQQGEYEGNIHETHLQPDLTPQIFDWRYPGFEPLWRNDLYGYYHRKL